MLCYPLTVKLSLVLKRFGCSFYFDSCFALFADSVFLNSLEIFKLIFKPVELPTCFLLRIYLSEKFSGH